jgi:integrase
MGRIHKLTTSKVASAKVEGLYGDGGGLHLRVARGGSRSWVFRYQRDFRKHDLGLGPYPERSLAEAREIAFEMRRKLINGLDPKEVRRVTPKERTPTFFECASAYMAAQESGWTAKHSEDWRRGLAHASALGPMLVTTVDSAAVLKVLTPIWEEKRATASRLRGRIETVIGFATARGYRTGDNPARWEILKHSLSNGRSIQHFDAMPYKDVPAFLVRLRQLDSIRAPGLEFVILTATRTSETTGALWSEIDGDIWIIPGSRMKAGKEHRVPLSHAAMAIIEKQRAIRHSNFIFPGRSGGQIGPTGLRDAMVLAGGTGTVHGFRSAFRDWAAEETHCPNHVVEQALAHTIGSAVEAAYRRGDLLEKRRQLMNDWAAFCGGVS